MRDEIIHALLLVPVWIFNSWCAIWVYKRNQKRKERQFLRRLQIQYPDATIQLIAVESSDKEAMAQIEQQLKES